VSANEIQLLGQRGDSDSGFSGEGSASGGSYGGNRPPERQVRDGEPRTGTVNDIPWDDSEPPF